MCKEAYDYIKDVYLKVKEHKHLLYNQRSTKYLKDAEIGEYFFFITARGDEHWLKCIDLRKCTGYDWREWCVSERDYIYYVPVFENNHGMRCAYTGKAVVITEEEFNTSKLKL